MRTVRLPGGETVPALGLGTWRMGERGGNRKAEGAALKLGLDLGLRLIDTAEMYADGGSEEVVADAIAGQRDQVFVVSKVYPHNAGRDSAIAACERSLMRLRTDRIDLYLLHWRGSIPLGETVEAFGRLRQAGKIRYFGVSNFDAGDMAELWRLPGGPACAANQVLYNLARRGIEFDLVPWCAEHGLPLMAYTPLEPDHLARHKGLLTIAKRLGVAPLQVALAWLLAKPQVICIPKASQPEHMRQNRAALDLKLTAEDLAELDRAFPPPKTRRPLEML
ncbi:MAG: aldo/keto reductase [Alphaproteobacteria bacterium]|nr:aldo/keto reductase [Alphaproteobacteria bacterium]